MGVGVAEIGGLFAGGINGRPYRPGKGARQDELIPQDASIVGGHARSRLLATGGDITAQP